MSDSSPGRVRHWIRHGPRENDGLLGFTIGMILWWRMVAYAGLLGVGGLGSMYAVNALDTPFVGLLIFIVAWQCGEWGLRLTPKYDVEKNF